jgi:hypothetical protein
VVVVADDQIERLRTYRAGIPRNAAGKSVRAETDERIRELQGTPRLRAHGRRRVRRADRG